MISLQVVQTRGEEALWQWTGEAGAIVESVRTTAGEEETVQQPGTTFYSTLTLRGERPLGDGRRDSFNMKLREPFSARRGNDRFTHIEWNRQRGGRELQLGTFTPRFHEWAIQHKRLTGLTLRQKSAERNWELFAGDEKRLPYTTWDRRRITGARFEAAIGRRSVFQSEFVSTQETGSGVRKRNSLWLGRIQVGRSSGSFAGVSVARSGGSGVGNAVRLDGQWRQGQARLQVEFEDVERGFETLSGYAYSGRQLLVTRILMPVGPHMTVATGRVRNRLPSHEVVSVPVSVQFKPYKDSPLTIQADYNSQNNRMPSGNTFNRTAGLGLQHALGPVLFQAGLLSDSYNSGESSKRTVFLDMKYQMSDQTSLRTRAQKENLKQEELPRHMYYMAMNFDLGGWTSLQLTGEVRDRLARNQKRITTGSRMRFLNPDTNMEISIDYKHINYSDHNEQLFTAEIENTF